MGDAEMSPRRVVTLIDRSALVVCALIDTKVSPTPTSNGSLHALLV
jgi:hypothetical protein